MGAFVALALAVVLLGGMVLLAGRSQRATRKQLEVRGRLGVATVCGYDSDGLAHFEFMPEGAASPVKGTEWVSESYRRLHPLQASVVVRYLPLCPAVHRLEPELGVDAVSEKVTNAI